MKERTLGQLRPGEEALVVSIGERHSAVRHRLMDMGLTPGTLVKVIKTAPFGDPVEIRLRGYELSVRKEDAAVIAVADAARARNGRAPRAFGGEDAGFMREAHEHELDEHSSVYDARAHDSRAIRVALAGNPNSGKTTLFNALTGSNQYVGNWPGVTVEKKRGMSRIGGHQMEVIDLPGIYSLSPYSMEEIISRDYLVGASGDAPDAIINIIDATNLERNLYLTVQLLELEKPVVIALNFMDEVRRKGVDIDVAQLSAHTGVSVVPISAKNGENIEELLHAVHAQIHRGVSFEPDTLYDDDTHAHHHRVGEIIHDYAYKAEIPAHWASIRLLEGDRILEDRLGLPDDVKEKISRIASAFEESSEFGDRETLVADNRYRFIEGVVNSALRGERRTRETMTERIDRIATHKILAVPLFLLMMLAMFSVTFGPVGTTLCDLVSTGIEWLRTAAGGWLSGAPDWVGGLVCDGIIAGVGGVLTFIPQITLLFLFLSFLEDTGYMARAAFIMDRLLRYFGLSGKAFIPMLMGFGCSVPAILGARTMENEKDRRMTIMLVPFMSCSAKLPIYGLIASAFFGRAAGTAVFGLYIFGILLAVISGIIFKKTFFKGEPAAFIMELPPYRMPSAKNTFMHVFDRVKDFLIRAGSIILATSVILWFLESFDTSLHLTGDQSKSLLAAAGTFISPLFKPLGFGFWQASVAILTGLIAKEAVVASLSMFYGFSLTAEGATVAAAMTGFTPATAVSFLVFVLLYVPCFAAVSAIYREMNSLKWTVRCVAWQLGIAWLMSFATRLITGVLMG